MSKINGKMPSTWLNDIKSEWRDDGHIWQSHFDDDNDMRR